MEIELSEVIKFCTRKLIKRTHFMSPLKMINLFQDKMPNVMSVKYPMSAKYLNFLPKATDLDSSSYFSRR